MYPQFELVLMVTHACNLRCAYCYIGEKFCRAMPQEIGHKAVDRALASLKPGGSLDLGFFGGEPLLEPDLVLAFIDYATRTSAKAGITLRSSLTTNGTISSGNAWSLLTMPELDLAISHDGLAELHNQNRKFSDGSGSSATVLTTISRLLAAGKSFSVVMVVTPGNVQALPQGIQFLQKLGVHRLEPSLDLWANWLPQDALHLELAINECANLWRNGLPQIGISWFDEKAALLSRIPIQRTSRCAFGNGQIAVAPSGRLYPCERLIGEDRPENPMQIVGTVMEGTHFVNMAAFPCRATAACQECKVQSLCNTICRCSNYARTGDVTRPDRLLCWFNQVTLRETARVMQEVKPL